MPDAPTYKKPFFNKQRGQRLRKQITLNTNYNKNTIFVRFYYSFVSTIKNINYKINFR